MKIILKDEDIKILEVKNKNKKQVEKDSVLEELEKEAKRINQIPEQRPGR